MKLGKANYQGTLSADSWVKAAEYNIATLTSATKLLIRGDSIGDATGKTVTAVGTAAVTTAQKKFNEVGSSIYVDGNSDYLSLADSADWLFGTDNFTIDMWVRWNSLPALYASQYFFATYQDATHRFDMRLDQQDANLWVFWLAVGATNLYWICDTLSINIWYHFALVRNGNSWIFYKNGVGMTEQTFSGSVPDTTTPFEFGDFNSGQGYFFNGYMSMVRITKGTALWTTTFTPPVYNDYYGAATSLSITGLDGNTDEEYKLICRFISGASSDNFYLRFNNDTGTNYGYQDLFGANASVGAQRFADAALWLGYYTQSTGLNYLLHSESLLYVKSGYVRTGITKATGTINGTTVYGVNISGQVWNNTADNITSLVIFADQTNGLGVGTVIELWKKIKKI